MELRWLEDYIALARTRHFSRAAEDQNVTQPTFSRRIKLLEDEIGAQLIDRHTLPLSLTPAGELFLEFAEQSTSQLRLTRERIEHIATQHHNKLLLTATQTLYISYCQAWLKGYSGDAEVSVDLNSSTWTRAEFGRALLEQRADLAICHWHDLMPSFLTNDELSPLQHKILGQDKLIPLSSAVNGSPIFSLGTFGKTATPYLQYDEKSYFSSVLRAHLDACKPELNLRSVNHSSQSLSVKAMVLQGYGVGWLPERLAKREIESGLLVPASSQHDIDLDIRIYCSPGNLKPALRALWSEL